MHDVELISIGDEILSGVTVNTNASWLAARLNNQGYRVRWITTIADAPGEIEFALSRALQRAAIIITTGGLGPTPDDLTRQALSRFFKTSMIVHEPTLTHIRHLFEARNLTMPEINRNQALVPRDAEIIDNPVGTAPGLLLRQKNSVFIFLPGVPTEMKEIFTSRVTEILQKELPARPSASYLLRTTGLPESRVVEKIGDILRDSSSLSISFLPKTSGVDVRIAIGRLTDENIFKDFVNRIRMRLATYIYTEEDITLAEITGKLLTEKNLTLSISESFTGGLISDTFTDIPGCSAYFMGSLIAYSNSAKIKLLGVRKQTLEQYGAVSEQTALEMVDGIQDRFSSDCALSSTGIAGPSGATPHKPVGLCYVAAKYGDKKTVKKFTFGKNRRMNKERGAAAAIELLRRLLTNG